MLKRFNFFTSFGRSRFIGFVVFLSQRISQVRLNQVSASLTFTTLLALVPFFTITLIVVSAFPMFDDISIRFRVFLATTLMPEYTAKIVGGYMRDFTQKAGNLTALGIAVLGASSILLMMTIERVFNQIWRIKNKRPFLLQMLTYWTVLTLGPLIIGAGLSTWSWLFRTTAFPETYPILADIVRVSGSIGMSTFLLYLLYRIVPYCYVPNRHALLGAFLASVALEIARRGFAYYIAGFANYQLIYGAFAVIPVFLLWVFFLWYILLLGAVVTASLSYWRGEAFRRGSDRRGRFDEVLELMMMLFDAHERGAALQAKEFRMKINVGYDELVELLDRLAKKDYVQFGKDGWVLKTSPDKIILSDLFSLFVYQPNQIQKNDAIADAIQDVLSPSLASLNLSLTEFAHRLDRK